MEVPPLLILYSVLLALSVGVLLYVFQVYDNAVFQINEAACRELSGLIAIAVDTVYYQPGNYVATIKLTHPVVLEGGPLLHVGRDTARPAQCSVTTRVDVEVLGGTGTEIVIAKYARLSEMCKGGEVFDGLRYVRDRDKLYIARRCESGQQTEDYKIQIYVR
ncbi:MAG: hypothetical protein QXH63_05395 [Pyrobaculum sp.]